MCLSTACGIGFHEVRQFLLAVFRGSGAGISTTHFVGDVFHVTELQGGGDVIAEKLNASIKTFAGMRAVNQFL